MTIGHGAPELAELVVRARPAAWAQAGFHVSEDRAQVGAVSILFRDEPGGRGIESWGLRGPRRADLDGLPTRPATDAVPSPEPPSHPNGVLILDHVVAFSPDLSRTVPALEEAGLDFRRLREGATPGGAQRQAFFRVGEAILEVVEHPPGVPESEHTAAPSRFYGLAFLAPDLEPVASCLGDLLGTPRDAVQPGRRIVTARREAQLGLPVAFITPRS